MKKRVKLLALRGALRAKLWLRYFFSYDNLIRVIGANVVGVWIVLFKFLCNWPISSLWTESIFFGMVAYIVAPLAPVALALAKNAIYGDWLEDQFIEAELAYQAKQKRQFVDGDSVSEPSLSGLLTAEQEVLYR